jgi:hypothetical protein
MFPLGVRSVRKHRSTNSGGVSGIDTPSRNAMGDETIRYFDLFHDALNDVGINLLYYSRTNVCKVLAGASRRQVEFPATQENMKNHYCHFRILNSIDSYINSCFNGPVPNYFQDHLVTPPVRGPFTTSYRAN